MVGTVNLDYRSLYHHFECAVYMTDCPCIGEVERDFLTTLEKCRRVTARTVKEEKWYVKLLGAVLKPFAPLM